MEGLSERLEKKSQAICAVLAVRGRSAKCRWFDGYYRKNAAGEYDMELFPIPVISVAGVCDIELKPYGIGITAKLKRADALAFPFEKLAGCGAEVYGVEHFLEDYYAEGDAAVAVRQKIAASSETSIAFAFRLSLEEETETIADAVDRIAARGFFY